MPDKPSDQSTLSTQPAPANPQTEPAQITSELVLAISDRIYAMLLRELKIERERQRFLMRSRPG
jgi:hypothetical protein